MIAKRCLSFTGKKLRDYLNETSIHGLRYLIESRNNVERMIWSVVICTSMAFASYNVYVNFVYSMDNPIITTLETTVVQNVRY